jgi:hypothetical protein
MEVNMRGSIFFRILGTLLIIALLVGAGNWIYQTGQAQGYAAGLAAADKGTTVNPPAPYPYYGYYGYGMGRPFFFPFFPIGGFFLVGGLFFLVFFVFGGWRRRWYHHGGYWGGQGPQQPGQPNEQTKA